MSPTTFVGSDSPGQFITDTGYIETVEKTIHERDVSYRFYLHQHPYVQELVQQLIRDSTSKLQATDTQYEPVGHSLPGSVEILLPNATVKIHAQARVALLQNTIALSEAGQMELMAGFMPMLGEPAVAHVPAQTPVTLIPALPETPAKNTTFMLRGDWEALTFDETDVMLTSITKIVLSGGEKATLPQGTLVRLAAGTPVSLPGNLNVVLKNSKPHPKYLQQLFVNYKPTDAVRHPHPVADLDFTSGGAYSVYNWELFFHVPFTIAVHLSKNQRFAEAQRWFHYLFDPTDDSNGGPSDSGKSGRFGKAA